MGHGRGMRNQRLNPSQRLAERTYAHFLQHFLGVVERSGLEGDHRAESAHLLLVQLILRMIRQSGVKNISPPPYVPPGPSPRSARCGHAAPSAPPVSSPRAAPASIRRETRSLLPPFA